MWTHAHARRRSWVAALHDVSIGFWKNKMGIMRFLFFFLWTSCTILSQHPRHFGRYSVVLNRFTLRSISERQLAVPTSLLVKMIDVQQQWLISSTAILCVKLNFPGVRVLFKLIPFSSESTFLRVMFYRKPRHSVLKGKRCHHYLQPCSSPLLGFGH